MIAVIAVRGLVTFAAAGGGSSGFGFHGGGGGRGAGLYLLFQLLFRLLLFGHGLGILIVIGLILAVVAFNYAGPRAEGFWQSRRATGLATRRRVARRERSVELAAAEAADEDEAFAPDAVRSEAAILFGAIQAAWDARDRTALARMVAPGLLAEWQRRLDDLARRGWHNRVAIVGEPTIEYVGLTHKQGESDRVVVRIEARMHDYVEDAGGNHIKRTGRLGETVRIREFWTLIRDQQRWMLASVEQGAEGTHALEQEIVATPWADQHGLHDQALIEGAVAEAVPTGTQIAEVADLDFQGDGRAAALDLSLADGRFAPDVLEVAARRAVAAWADAVDGNDAALRAIARPEAARELLHPGDPGGRTRLVVRGPEVRKIVIVSLDAAGQPPSMTIDVEISGRRYVEDRDTAAILAGSQTRTTRFTERWMLALDGDTAQPWRISAVLSPVAPR